MASNAVDPESISALVRDLEITFADQRSSAAVERDALAAEAMGAALARVLFHWIVLHRDHPAAAHFEMLGNGIFEDDHSLSGELPAPHFFIFRFTCGSHAAYVWRDGESWAVTSWRRIRGGRRRNVEAVGSFRDALDRLLPLPRPWWKFWR
jgi:hypothetical protein